MGFYNLFQYRGDRGYYIAGETTINENMFNQMLDQFEKVLNNKLADIRIENLYFFGDVVLLPNNQDNKIPMYFIIDTGNMYELYLVYDVRNGEFKLKCLGEDNDFETLVNLLSKIGKNATDYYHGVYPDQYDNWEDNDCDEYDDDWEDDDCDEYDDWEDDDCNEYDDWEDDDCDEYDDWEDDDYDDCDEEASEISNCRVSIINGKVYINGKVQSEKEINGKKIGKSVFNIKIEL